METTTRTQNQAMFQNLLPLMALGAIFGGATEAAQATPSLPLPEIAEAKILPSAELLAEGRRIRLHAIRLYHARELLGGGYKSSIVKATESQKDVENFVFNKVHQLLPAAWKKSSERITRAVLTQSIEHGFDPIFLLSVMWTESSFRPDQVGGVGEIGLMQIRPETAAWLSKKIGYTRYTSRTSLFDPVVNIELGTAYFAMLRQSFDDDGQLYISAYNMGSTNVRRLIASTQKRPSEYSGRVLGNYRALYKAFAPTLAAASVQKGRRVAMN
jgi:soluble lytic murein transglycosylase